MGFNKDDYAEVWTRLIPFWEKHPKGRIETSILRITDDYSAVIFEAKIYREGEELPFANGIGYGKQGVGMTGKTHWLETAETSAVGRALANAGWHGKKVDGTNAKRPSCEEMQQTQRSESAHRQDVEQVVGGGHCIHDGERADAGGVVVCDSCKAPMLSDPQRKKLGAQFREIGFDDEKRREFLLADWGRKSMNDLSKAEATKLIGLMENAGKGDAE